MNDINKSSSSDDIDTGDIENQWDIEFSPSEKMLAIMKKYNALSNEDRKKEYWPNVRIAITEYIKYYNEQLGKKGEISNDDIKKYIFVFSKAMLKVLKIFLKTEKKIQEGEDTFNDKISSIVDKGGNS